jgi:hypothetical protein
MGTKNRPTRAMFIGTCRMHDPVKALETVPGIMARMTPHRLHTPGQVVQFVQHMSGSPQYLPRTLHLISDYAAAQVLELGTPRQDLLDMLAPQIALWPSFQAFVIEICSLREYTTRLRGRAFVVNTFSQRDQHRYAEALAAQAAAGHSVPALPIEMERLGAAATHRQMRRIKSALGDRPVIWVSHQRPPSDSPEHAAVNATRRAGADILQAGAAAMGDDFLDPSTIAAEMGQQAFFLKDGTDLDHMTPAAAKRLGAIYSDMILAAVARARANAKMTLPAETRITRQTAP